MESNNVVRFALYAQNRNCIVVLKDMEQGNFIMQTAREVLSNSLLSNNLSEKDTKIIKAIDNSGGDVQATITR